MRRFSEVFLRDEVLPAGERLASAGSRRLLLEGQSLGRRILAIVERLPSAAGGVLLRPVEPLAFQDLAVEKTSYEPAAEMPRWLYRIWRLALFFAGLGVVYLRISLLSRPQPSSPLSPSPQTQPQVTSVLLGH